MSDTSKQLKKELVFMQLKEELIRTAESIKIDHLEIRQIDMEKGYMVEYRLKCGTIYNEMFSDA